MKKVLLLATVLSGIAAGSSAFAAAATGFGPEVIKMKMGGLPLAFPHWRHQVLNNSECSNCHKADGGKIEGWGKETAHTLCIPCHDLNDKGPVECKQCHK